MVRFTLAGTEVVLRLSGIAAKNFAMFAYAVLKDQKKTRGKTRLVRMLREGRSFKFYKIPVPLMKEFTQQAKSHGLLYVPIRDKQDAKRIEVAVFADDAAKVQRICDRLHIDYSALVISICCLSNTALAANDPLGVVSNLSSFIFSLIRAIGLILLGWGVVQVGLSFQSHDPSQRSQGFLTLAGGLVVTFAKEILDLITG